MTKNDQNLKDVEAEKANIQEALEGLRAELVDVRAQLEQAVTDEASSLRDAARQGRAPKSSKLVEKLRTREAEIVRALPLIELEIDAVEHRRLELAIEEAEKVLSEKSAAVQKVDEELRVVQERRRVAENERYLQQQELEGLRSALRGLERRREAQDPEYRAQLEEERQRRREEVEEMQKAWQQQAYEAALVRAGVYEVGDPELQELVRSGRVGIVAKTGGGS